ncbi:transcriptional regulator [Candidatus Saccharibacteria bacterium RIFCSPHIGHO2_12_FULL_42_8]|nr:MAG: transcriptional regulator [Candidatus Saccharibacteria bacterium RIFCSPHIGHO2_12_FULL_42_8]
MIDTLFGSKTRVKLLYLFLNNPGRAFYVREITRRVDEQINSVRRELANMLNVGVIKSDSVDNKLYYEVDTSYMHYEPLHKIFSDTSAPSEISSEVASTTDWSKRVKQLSGVKALVLSGSYVTGARSKVDILIVGNVPKAKLKKFVKDLEEDEHRTISYATLKYDDFYYRLSLKDRFVSEIIDGKHVVVTDINGILSK